MVDTEVDTNEIKKLSSFVLDDVFKSKEEMKEKLEKFQKDLEEEFDDNEERVFVKNIISYLQWRLEERENAFKSINIAEKLQKTPNLITHCNKILFYIESGKHYRSAKLVEELKNNDHFKQTRTKSEARAEIGYCYSRLGPKHHGKAVELFKEVIENIRPHRNILWEFRLALTLRRQTHMFQMTKPEISKSAERKEEAARLLYDILKFKTNDNRFINIKARACCELSKILFRRKSLFEIIHTDRKETEKITECWCFEEAMRLCPNQYFVLQQYGTYLRYILDLEISKEMLERSLRLKDTLYSRHHLALTLKRIVEKATPKPSFVDKSRYAISLAGKGQSELVSDYEKSSMSKEFDSLTVDETQRVDYVIQNESVQFNPRSTTTLYKRSKSTGSVKTHGNCIGKCDPFASENRLSVPNVLKSPSKFQSHTTSLKDNQSREESKSYHNQAGAIDQKGTFISTRKSPRFVCVSPNNPLLLQAVEHLQKAIEMSKEYGGTRYELGLIYRMLDRPDDALKCFSFITSSSCGNPSEYPMYAINAYEQQSFCKLDLIDKAKDPEKKKELRFDAKKCAWMALTIVSTMIGALPTLKVTCQCFPTLKELLQNEDNSCRKFKELAKLHEKLDYDKESIRFYKHIIKEESDPATMRELAQNYRKVGDFANAICTLSLLQTLKITMSDKSFYVDTCIKGAKNSLIKEDDLDMAKIRFFEAYRTIFSHQNVPKNEGNQTIMDMLVLDSCGDDNCCYQNFVTSSLKTFVKSKFTVNDFDCPPPCRRFEYLIEAMCRSHCILVIHHESKSGSGAANADEFIDRAMEIACVKHQTKILQIRKQEVEQYPPGCKEIVLTCGSGDIANNDSSQILLKGNLFSDVLCKLSEMFLRESIDFDDFNRL